MRVETVQVNALSSVRKTAGEIGQDRKTGPVEMAADSVSIGSGRYLAAAMQAGKPDRVAAFRALQSSYSPAAADIAAAMLSKGFDR